MPETGDGPRVIVLNRGATIEGVVVDPFGKPVPEARVVASREANRVGWPLGTAFHQGVDPGNAAETDEHGKFVVAGLWPDAEYEVRAMRTGWEQVNEGYPPLGRAGTRGLELRLVPIATLRVVIDAGLADEDVVPWWVEATHGQNVETTGGEPVFAAPAEPTGDHVRYQFRFRATAGGRSTDAPPSVTLRVEGPGFVTYESPVELTWGRETVQHVSLAPEATRRFST